MQAKSQREIFNPNLELAELLDSLASSGKDTENVESDGLAQRSALANGNLVTFFNTESWGNVGSEVLVSLLVTGVFGDEVEVFSADDESSVHFGGDDGSGQDTATDGDETGEWALLVCLEISISTPAIFPQRHLPSLQSIEIEGSKLQPARPLATSRSPKEKNPHTNISSLNGSLWCSETKTDILVPAAT